MTATAAQIERVKSDPELTGIAAGFFVGCLAPEVRKLSQFMRQEIRIPNGPRRGRRYDWEPSGIRWPGKPSSKLWFDQIDSGHWKTHIYTGPTQSGKTLDAFVGPTLWCLFEKRQDTIVGLPDINLAKSKWEKDLKPIIETSRYQSLMPIKGEGSQGGRVKQIRFQNGVWLTFMSFGGSDKSKAGDTAQNIIITETDGANIVGEASQEDNSFKQICARSDAFDDDAFIVAECTVSIDTGITWHEYQNGSASRILRPCPHCGEYVWPLYDHFRGYETARTHTAATEQSFFHCPECTNPWTDDERWAANLKSVLVHKGQSVDADGNVTGPMPATDTLGFRLSAVDNPMRTSPNLGGRCWKALRAADPITAQKSIFQFQFAKPWSEDVNAEEEISSTVADRFYPTTGSQGQVPGDFELVTMGIDVGLHKLHWVVKAWNYDATNVVVTYGTTQVPSRRMSYDRAIQTALRNLRDTVISAGFPIVANDQLQRPDGAPSFMWPQYVFVDAGYQTNAVYSFIQECNAMQDWALKFWPIFGRGVGKHYQQSGGRYVHKEQTSSKIKLVGDQFYMAVNKEGGVIHVILNADYYKAFEHNRWRTPPFIMAEKGLDEEGNPVIESTGEISPGAGFFMPPTSGEHIVFVNHLKAEKMTRTWLPDQGEVVVWKVLTRVNHYLDASAYADAAAVLAGVVPTDQSQLTGNEFVSPHHQRRAAHHHTRRLPSRLPTGKRTAWIRHAEPTKPTTHRIIRHAIWQLFHQLIIN